MMQKGQVSWGWRASFVFSSCSVKQDMFLHFVGFCADSRDWRPTFFVFSACTVFCSFGETALISLSIPVQYFMVGFASQLQSLFSGTFCQMWCIPLAP